MRLNVKTDIDKVWKDQLSREYDLLEQYHRNIGPFERFLEIGCGSLGFLGRKGNRLNKFFEHSMGIDIDLNTLLRNRQVRFPLCASSYSLPLSSASVDIVVCRWVFEHLEHPEVIIKEISRVLKKRGDFCL